MAHELVDVKARLPGGAALVSSALGESERAAIQDTPPGEPHLED